MPKVVPFKTHRQMIGVEQMLIHKRHFIAGMIKGIGGPGSIPVAEIHHWDAQEVQEGPAGNSDKLMHKF
jgi:hypothetical protein